MALKTPIPVQFRDVFPEGAYFVGVEPINDFEKAQAGGMDPQERDKESGERLWAVRVLDADPNARAGSLEVKVKVAAPMQPVPPASMPGSPFTPIEFDGMTVTPWVDTNRLRPKQAYSLRAKAMHAPAGASKSERAGAPS